MGAFKLVQKSQAQVAAGAGVSKKEVRRAIKGIQAAQGGDVEMDGDDEDAEEPAVPEATDNDAGDDFVEAMTTTPRMPWPRCKMLATTR